MSKNPKEYLRHILDEIDYLQRSSKRVSFNQFIIDEDLKRAYARSIGIIGEATRSCRKILQKSTPKLIGSRWLI